MSKRSRDLTAEEKKLWRRVATSVKARKPIPADPDVDAAPDTPAVRHMRVSEPAKPSTPMKKIKTAPLANRGAEKRVRRGKLEVGASLDLHGHTQDSARAALGRFVRAAHARGDRTIVVITGVGRSGQGVLKQRLPEWLEDRGTRELVAGFAQAHRDHGGAGAYYIFLKRARVDAE